MGPTNRKVLGFIIVAACAGGLAFVASGQAWPWRSTSPLVQVQFAPDPDDLFNFLQDGFQSAFTVPAGVDLVLTDSFHQGRLTINGSIIQYPGGLLDTSTSFDPGLVVHSGDTLDIQVAGIWSSAGVAGYFVDHSSPPFATRLAYTPDPREIVYLENTGPAYTVPAGKHLVIRWTLGPCYVNGVNVWDPSTAATLQSGILARSGDTVTPTYALEGFLRPN